MDRIVNFRIRRFLAILAAAVVTAAALRHVIHVYGGLPREEIRSPALIVAVLIGAILVMLCFRKKGQP
jgi:hypothetical protein